MPRKAQSEDSKARKRGQGEGSIRKRKDGTWEARYTIGRDANGKQIQKSIYNKNSMILKQELRDILTKINKGTYTEPSKITVKDWLDTWLWEYKKDSVKISTFTRYESLSRVHIIPSIGNYYVRDLRPEHIQKFINAKGKEGLSPRSLKYIHVTLHNALDQALKNGIVTRNAAEAVTLPRQHKKEIRILTLDEQKKFLEAAKGHRYEAAFVLTLFTGLRLGELLALSWEDVDLSEGILRVSRTIQRVKTTYDKDINMSDKGIKKSEVVIQQSPKTKSGFRSIPLLDEVISVLKAHKKRQSEEKLKNAALYTNNGLVFCDEVGKWIEPRQMIRYFELVAEKAGLGKIKMPKGWEPGDELPNDFSFPKWFIPPEGWEPGKPLPKDFKPPKGINFHALRHTFATRGLENGIPAKIMQEILGHSSITMTLDLYSHVLPETKKEAMRKLEGLLKAE
jgi:integrase